MIVSERCNFFKHSSYSNFPAVAILIIIGFTVYGNSLGNSFVWDDELLVTANSSIRSLCHIPSFFFAGLAPEIGGNFYRPLQSLSYAVDFQCWGLNPFGYHLTNLLIHIANSVLVFFLIFALTNRRPVSFISSLLFLIHPVQTEAVAYIAGRSDLLAAFFLLFSLFFSLAGKKYLRPIQSVGLVKSVYLLLSILFFLLALLAKEAAIILPFLVVLCGCVLRKKPVMAGEGRPDFFTPPGMIKKQGRETEDREISGKSIRERVIRWPAAHCPLPIWYYVALFLVALLYALARYAIIRSGADPLTSNPYPFYERFLTGWKVVFLYIKVLLFPVHLRMERVIPISTTFFSSIVLVPLAVFSGIAVCLVKAYRRSKVLFFGGAWFFLALPPYMNWFPLNAEMAEHWLYLPSVGYFLLIAIFVEMIIIWDPKNLSSAGLQSCLDQAPPWRGTTISSLPGTRRSKNSLIGCTLLFTIIVSLAALTIRRNLDWKDNKTIYRATAGSSPGSPRARYNLGNIYLAEGRLDEAVREYRASLRIKPGDARCRGNLGKALLGLNRIPEAVREFEGAVSLRPENPPALTKLGAAYGLSGRPHDAVRVLQRSIIFDKNQPEAYNNLGSVYTRLERYDEAVRAYREALTLNPGMIEAVFNLGVVYYYQDRLDEAEKLMDDALHLDPNFTRAHIWREKIRDQGD